jgi:hypothetical protein
MARRGLNHSRIDKESAMFIARPQHNQTVVRPLPLIRIPNHNQTLVIVAFGSDPGLATNHNQTLVRR